MALLHCAAPEVLEGFCPHKAGHLAATSSVGRKLLLGSAMVLMGPGQPSCPLGGAQAMWVPRVLLATALVLGALLDALRFVWGGTIVPLLQMIAS